MTVMAYVCVFMAGLLSVGFAGAQEQGPTMPDDPLYQAKRAQEATALNAGDDPLEKAALYNQHAQARVAEIEAVIDQKKPEFVDELVKDYDRAVAGARGEINRARAQGRAVDGALDEVEKSTARHTEVLTGLLDRVPAPARPAIAHALEVSRQERQRVRAQRQKERTPERSRGRPEQAGRSKSGRTQPPAKPMGAGSPAGKPAGRR